MTEHSVVQCCIVFGEVYYLQACTARDLSCFVTVKRSRRISDRNVMASYFIMMLLVFRLNLCSCYVHCIHILELHGIHLMVLMIGDLLCYIGRT